MAQCVSHNSRLISHKQQQVAGLGTHTLAQCFQLLRSKELGDGRFYAVFGNFQPGQTFGAVDGHISGQRIDLAAGILGAALGVDTLYTAAGFGNAGKNLKFAVHNQVSNIDQRQIKTQIGFIGTVGFHSLMPGQALKGSGNSYAQSLVKDFSYHALHQGLQLNLINKGHFQVKLGKFRLTVGTQVLITEAAGNLEVFIKTGHHQQLLVKLRRLRQSIEIAGVYAAGHQIVTGTLRGALAQHGGFNLQKAVAVQIITHGKGHLMTQLQISLHLGAAQIQITVFQAHQLVHINAVLDVKGWGFGGSQHTHLADINLNFAGGQIGVYSTLRARTNLTNSSQHILITHTLGLTEGIGTAFRVKNNLYHTGTVTQVNKNQTTMVTAALYPTHQHNFLADMSRANFCTHHAALQAIQRFTHQNFLQYNNQ